MYNTPSAFGGQGEKEFSVLDGQLLPGLKRPNTQVEEAEDLKLIGTGPEVKAYECQTAGNIGQLEDVKSEAERQLEEAEALENFSNLQRCMGDKAWPPGVL